MFHLIDLSTCSILSMCSFLSTWSVLSTCPVLFSCSALSSCSTLSSCSVLSTRFFLSTCSILSTCSVPPVLLHLFYFVNLFQHAMGSIRVLWWAPVLGWDQRTMKTGMNHAAQAVLKRLTLLSQRLVAMEVGYLEPQFLKLLGFFLFSAFLLSACTVFCTFLLLFLLLIIQLH